MQNEMAKHWSGETSKGGGGGVMILGAVCLSGEIWSRQRQCGAFAGCLDIVLALSLKQWNGISTTTASSLVLYITPNCEWTRRRYWVKTIAF